LIALHDGEESFPTAYMVTLCEPPASVLVKLQSTKSGVLPGLQDGVIPITPIEWTFTLTEMKRKQCQGNNYHWPAYMFTDYCSQGQKIDKAIIDIAMPPSGRITPFNIYSAPKNVSKVLDILIVLHVSH